MARDVTVRPEAFTLVPYDADEIVALVRDVAERVGLPAGVAVRLEVDEELFAPLTGSMVDVVDGEARLWVSGANFEDRKQPRSFSARQARPDLAVMLLRAADRLGAFADAPPDAELTLAERAAWDVAAWGRAQRLGFEARPAVRRYEFRLQHGFTDVADAAFDRLAASDDVSYADVRAACKETGAARRPPSKVPADVLRRRDPS